MKRSTDLVLGCSDRRVVLEDVFIEGKKVRLLGVAAREFAGRKVPMVFGATGKTVATVTVGADGHFTATAPLPAKKLRNSNKARYVAKIGSEASLALKLARRMLVTKVAAAGDKVTIAGQGHRPAGDQVERSHHHPPAHRRLQEGRDGKNVRAGQERLVLGHRQRPGRPEGSRLSPLHARA